MSNTPPLNDFYTKIAIVTSNTPTEIMPVTLSRPIFGAFVLIGSVSIAAEEVVSKLLI